MSQYINTMRAGLQMSKENITDGLRPIGSVMRAGWNDMKAASPVDRAIFLGTTAVMGVHEAGMEAALFYAGTHTLEATNNPLLVAGALGGMSLATESAITLGIAHNIENFKEVTNKAKDRYFFAQTVTEQKPTTGKAVVDAIDTTLLAVGLGSAGVILRDYTRDPERGYEANKQSGFRIAKALGALNATLGLTLGGAGWIGEKLGTDSITNAVVEVGDSRYTYGAIAAYVVFRIKSASNENKRLRLAAAGESN